MISSGRLEPGAHVRVKGRGGVLCVDDQSELPYKVIFDDDAIPKADWLKASDVEAMTNVPRSDVQEAPRNDAPTARELKVYFGIAWTVPTTFSFRIHADGGTLFGEGYNKFGPFSVAGISNADGESTMAVSNQHGTWHLKLRWDESSSKLAGVAEGSDGLTDVALVPIGSPDPDIVDQLLVWSCMVSLAADTPPDVIQIVFEYLPQNLSEIGWRNRTDLEPSFLQGIATNGVSAVARGLPRVEAQKLADHLGQIGVQCFAQLDLEGANAARLLPPPPSRRRQDQTRSRPARAQRPSDREAQTRMLRQVERMQELIKLDEFPNYLERLHAVGSTREAKAVRDEFIDAAKRTAVNAWLADHHCDNARVGPDWECPVCFEEASDDVLAQVCQNEDGQAHHVFHKRCIGDWLTRRNECPTCRRAPVVELLRAIAPECHNT